MEKAAVDSRATEECHACWNTGIEVYAVIGFWHRKDRKWCCFESEIVEVSVYSHSTLALLPGEAKRTDFARPGSEGERPRGPATSAILVVTIATGAVVQRIKYTS